MPALIWGRYFRFGGGVLDDEIQFWLTARAMVDNYGNVNVEILSEDEVTLYERVGVMINTLPENYHRCIGCPCYEFDFPMCETCPFHMACINGDKPFPAYCDPLECGYVKDLMFILEKKG